MNEARWLTVEQIRKQQRMRRERVLEAMLNGELPYELRGQIRYARVCDVEAWEQRRLKGGAHGRWPRNLRTLQVDRRRRDPWRYLKQELDGPPAVS